MESSLDIHRASATEKEEAHRNCFDLWGKKRTLAEHIEHRSTAPSCRRARWYVGCVDGRVVTSLGSYPFAFRVRGEEVSGIGIGSVYTVAEHRGRGLAPRLLEWVEDREREAGAGLSVLFSNIPQEYYARLGYVLCPSLEGWCRLADVPADAGGGGCRLVSFAPAGEVEAMAALYDREHADLPFSIVRGTVEGADLWRDGLKEFAEDLFFWVESPGGDRLGYVRLRPDDAAVRIVDDALPGRNDERARELYAAVAEEARKRGFERLGGWLADCPATRRFFELSPRSVEITMVKPLAWRGTLDAELSAAAESFHEIDHI